MFITDLDVAGVDSASAVTRRARVFLRLMMMFFMRIRLLIACGGRVQYKFERVVQLCIGGMKKGFVCLIRSNYSIADIVPLL